jgi:SAM-dependent methyltransferase
MRALEIGCGTGLFTAYFAATGADVIATDISSELLEVARDRLRGAANVEILHGRFEDLPLDGGFDAVVGSSVLHHLELQEALPRIFELLRSGGHLSFAEPNMLNPQIFLERKVPFVRERMHVSPDETAFVRWTFANQLRRWGFADVRLTPFDWLHPFTPRRAIGVVGAVGAALERLPLLREFAGSLVIHARKPV